MIVPPKIPYAPVIRVARLQDAWFRATRQIARVPQLGQMPNQYLYWGGALRRQRNYKAVRRSRNELPMTVTELMLIAALAIIGFKSKPQSG
jgi:hypothetical protein